VRNAAVAVILQLGAAGAPEVLFVARAEYAGDPWSAHVAFPGGRAEPVDVSPVETAVRETQEEIGLDLRATGAVLGVLPAVAPQAVRLPAVRVRPVVAIVVDLPELVPGPEVRAAFWVPLSALATVERWRPTRVDAGGTTLTVSAFTDGEYVIWGLTARIVRLLVSVV
jgi:8-oxo-dGTP pyrophosphatase MutT (NUDIX family)